MVALRHRWTDPPIFQADNYTVEWTWPVGEREHYWGYSFRPFQANQRRTEILRQFTSSDNNLRHTEHFIVSVQDGNLFRLSAISVEGA